MRHFGLQVITVLCCLLAYSGVASAANRTYCFNRVVLEDSRTDCPAPGAQGARYTCANGVVTDMPPSGFEVMLYDKDTAGADDYIGVWIWPHNSFAACITFPWEGTAASLDNGVAEANPDVYLAINYTTWATPRVAYATNDGDNDGDGEPLLPWLFRDSASSNCTTAGGAACTQAATLRGPAAGTLSGARMMGLATLYTGMRTFVGEMTGNVELLIPAPTCNGCAGTSSRRKIVGIEGLGRDGGLMHELGHVLHESKFDMDVVYDDYSWGFDPWKINSIEWQNAATTEGWASYLHMAGWYNPQTATAPKFRGFDLESATPMDAICSTNAWIVGQVAKVFWDLDDANAENPVAPAALDRFDHTDLTTTQLIQGWSTFAAGTADRQREEGGRGCATNIQGFPSPSPFLYCDSHGINVWDYWVNALVGNAAAIDTIFHNCVHNQDFN